MINAIEVVNLTKLYNSSKSNKPKFAIEKLNLSIPVGSIFGLLGPNGAGKSTLINILAGTVTKTSGSAYIMGIDIEKHPKLAKSKIGVVPQEIALDNFFTIYQALEFTAGYYGITPKYRKTEEILKALSLWDKKEALPRHLSGGMKRRFLIAKAMVHSPAVLVLDEPTAGVDIELRDQLWEYVKILNHRGTTIIITTHYLAEAEELCSHIAFINKGTIIKQDTKENILNEVNSRHIDIEFTSPINKIPHEIIEDYEILTPNKLRLYFNSQNQTINAKLSQIHQINLPIKNIEISQPDLEVIFRKLINKI